MRALLTMAAWMLASTLILSIAEADERSDADRVAERATMQLFEPEVDVATRREVFAELEARSVLDPDPSGLYQLGSLYRRGDTARERAFEKDLDKAREYLSRAALAGVLRAMAKLSVLELEARNTFEANVWAQLYHHYAKDAVRRPERLSDGFAASLIANAQRKLDDSQIDALNDSVGLMIGNYDAKIRAGMARMALEHERSPLQPTHSGPRTLLNGPPRTPDAGVAEFLAAFDVNGEVEKLWVLDAWPDPSLARVLRHIAMGYRVEAAGAAQAPGQIALLPIEFNDLRHQIRKRD